MRTPLALLFLLLGTRVSAQEAADGAPLRFESSELRELAGTWGEPFRAVLLLPGVGHVLSGTGHPVVRGAPPSATLFSLDGVRVPMLYHLGLGPAVVHPELIAGLDFHRGAAPARFGRDAGGTVELRLTPPRVEEARTVASLDLVNVGLFTQLPIASTGTEVTMAGRFAYTPWLYAVSRSDRVANVFDYQARITQSLGEGSLRLLAFGGSDTAGTRGEGTVAEVGAGFHRVDLRLSQPLGVGEAQVALTWGVDRLAFGGGGDISRVAVRLTERTFGARLAWNAPLSEHAKLEVGADVERRLAATHQSSTLRPGDVTDPARPTVITTVQQPVAGTTLAGVHAQLAWEHGPWRLTPGLRVDSYHLGPGQTDVVLEPRLHARRGLTDTVAVRLGAGLAHQMPGYLVEAPVEGHAARRLGLQRTVQLGAGVDALAPAGFQLSADAFLHPLLRTVELDLFALDFLDADTEALAASRVARGLAYGVELMARRPLTERWSLLASYTFQRRTLRTRVERRDETGALLSTETVSTAAALEQAHILNAAVTVKLRWGVTLGATLHYNTGAPEAGGLSSYTRREGVDPLLGGSRWVDEDRDRVARLPGFFRVDARVAKAGTLGPVALEAWLDIINLTLARETFRYSYGEEEGRLTRKPMGVPPLTLPSLGVKATY
ncbi:MAG: TonB-dependent receptor [Myxococcaceae bacterium]|nr:TonB-dependent receptor [Myxococcaceae bacterium]